MSVGGQGELAGLYLSAALRLAAFFLKSVASKGWSAALT